MYSIKIANKTIREDKPSFIIAEAGVNHNNNLSLALKMVDIAVKAKADAIKFQTFQADEIQLKDSKKPRYQNTQKGKSYYNLIKELEPSLEDQRKIFKYCKKKKILFISTPYDKKSLDFLDELGVEAFKISSSDLTNHIFLEQVISKRKPVLLSTGLSNMKLVKQSVELFEKKKMKTKLILLQATSDYPTNESDVNLKVIEEYKKKFNVLVGYSDHTMSGLPAYGAVVLGAKVFEKHFTVDRKLPGPDQLSSLEPNELVDWIKNIRLMEKSLGSNKKEITDSERKNITMRKVLIIKLLVKNSKINNIHLAAMRGNEKGILPTLENIHKIVGKKINCNINYPTQFSWKMIK